MRIGTKSVLFGAHQFILHPLFVAAAWWKLFGFPWDPRLWVAFAIHDVGYLGKPDMDGPDGERHVELGAAIMGFLFDHGIAGCEYQEWSHPGKGVPWRLDSDEFRELLAEGWRIAAIYESFTLLSREQPRRTWREFCLYHSRFRARQDRQFPSRLCAADKLAMAMEPWWLYLPRVMLSGEVWEFMAGHADGGKYRGDLYPPGELEELTSGSLRRWHRTTAARTRRLAYRLRDKFDGQRRAEQREEGPGAV